MAEIKFTKISLGIVDVFEKMGITVSPSQTGIERTKAFYTIPMLQDITSLLIFIYCKTVNRDKHLTFFLKEDFLGASAKLQLTEEDKNSLVVTEDEVAQVIDYFREKLPVIKRERIEDNSVLAHLAVITFHLAHTLYKRKMS